MTRRWNAASASHSYLVVDRPNVDDTIAGDGDNNGPRGMPDNIAKTLFGALQSLDVCA